MPNIVYALIEGPGGRGGAVSAGAGAPPPADGGRSGGAARCRRRATGLYRSDDAGATWRKVSSVNPRPLYFSQVRIDPNNSDRAAHGRRRDAHDGRRRQNVRDERAIRSSHDDMHAIWIDPNTPTTCIIGNDGGVARPTTERRRGAFLQNLPVGLFYHVGYDMETPFNVCGGMQDNYDWCGPSLLAAARTASSTHDWFQIEGGDGFVAIPDRRDSRIIYSESQDGNMIRKNKVTGEVEEHSSDGAERHAGAEAGRDVPLPLGHADDPLAASIPAR